MRRLDLNTATVLLQHILDEGIQNLSKNLNTATVLLQRSKVSTHPSCVVI